MPLNKEKKKEYQREYMKRKRSNNQVLDPVNPVRPMLDPQVLDPVRPECPECRKKDIYIMGLEAQIQDLTYELEQARTQRHASKRHNSADDLPFSKARQVRQV